MVKFLGSVIYSVAFNQSKETAELNPVLQCSIWLYEPGLACFSYLAWSFNFVKVYYLLK